MPLNLRMCRLAWFQKFSMPLMWLRLSAKMVSPRPASAVGSVPETVRQLFEIISEDKRAQREAQIEAEKTPEEKQEGWTP